MLNILITGHRGFIGQHMVNALSHHNLSFYEWGSTYPTIDNLDWVIHLGGISSTTETNIEKIMMQNYDFSCWLLDQCVAKQVNFQYSSSASIYGLKTEFTESSPVDPRTPYAWSKYFFENYASKQSGIIIQGFRYFNVFGKHEDHKGSQASPYHQFGKQAANGLIKIFKDSNNFYRDFVPVEIVCRAHKLFLNVKDSGIFNIGTGVATSFYDIAKTFDVPIEEIDMPTNLIHSYQKYTCADMTKTNNALNNIGEKL